MEKKDTKLKRSGRDGLNDEEGEIGGAEEGECNKIEDCDKKSKK